MKMRLLAVSLIVLVAFATVGLAWAQTSPDQHDITWHVVGAAGQDSGSTTHQVRGTLGQLAIGPAAASGGHQLASGYWYGAGRKLPLRVYLPLVFKSAAW